MSNPALQQRLRDVWQEPLMARILPLLAPYKAYLVGGAVRDILRGVSSKDLDLVVDCEPEQILHLKQPLKKALSISVIVLDSERGIIRVCFREPDGIDLAARQGTTILEDLARRDLTINAMAAAPDGHLVDPFDGTRDLRDGIIRVTAPEVLHDDPLRVVRCLRFAANLRFRLDEVTRSALPVAAPKLKRVAGERISVELFALLRSCDEEIWPELQHSGLFQALWGIDDQSIPWLWLEQWLGSRPKEEKRRLEDAYGVLCAVLNQARPNLAGKEALLDRLLPSRAQLSYSRSWWRSCAALEREHPETTRELYALIATSGEALGSVLQFASLSAFKNPLTQAQARRIASAADGTGELRTDPMPVKGEELYSHLNRPPGPWLGTLMDELKAAWACRELQTKEELLAYSASFL